MTDDNGFPAKESRRSLLKKGTLASGALAFGLGSAGPAAAQGDGNQTAGTTTSDAGTGDQTGGGEALILNSNYHPGAQFRVVSPVIEQKPDLQGVQEGDVTAVQEVNVFANYNTRIIEYVNTNEQAMFFPAQDAEIEQGNVYEFGRVFETLENSPARGLISVEFQPVPEEDVLFDDDANPGFEPGEDFGIVDGGGNAIMTGYRFYPGALFRVTSGIIEGAPRQEVQELDVFSGTNTRLAEYLGTELSFVFYPANDASVEKGAIYVMRDGTEPVDTAGRFVAVEFSRVDRNDLDEGLL